MSQVGVLELFFVHSEVALHLRLVQVCLLLVLNLLSEEVQLLATVFAGDVHVAEVPVANVFLGLLVNGLLSDQRRAELACVEKVNFADSFERLFEDLVRAQVRIDGRRGRQTRLFNLKWQPA